MNKTPLSFFVVFVLVLLVGCGLALSYSSFAYAYAALLAGLVAAIAYKKDVPGRIPFTGILGALAAILAVSCIVYACRYPGPVPWQVAYLCGSLAALCFAEICWECGRLAGMQ